MSKELLVDRYIDILKSAGKKPGTLKQYASDLNQFISWLDSSHVQTLHALTSEDMNTYVNRLEEKQLRPATMKRHLSAINQFLAHHQLGIKASSDQDPTRHAIPLTPQDFVSHHEITSLLDSMKKPIRSAARDELINRNLAIVHLLRYKGLRPKDLSALDMNTVNLAQSTIQYSRDGRTVSYSLSPKEVQYLRDYIMGIEPLKRPRFHTDDPLFVAYNNRSKDYQSDYVNQQPKRLSVRSIQEMIKDEVRLAGLRKISAKHLRNSCILDHVQSGQNESDIQHYFHLTHSFSLHRYKQYMTSPDFLTNETP
ncbi:site-specific recombinase XerD [Rossellomorea marisflavi]